MSKKQNEIIKKLVETGSDISGSIGGALVGGFIAGPPGLIIGGASGPLITQLFKKIGTEITHRFLSGREETRIGAIIAFALSKINDKIDNGNSIRDDDFFESIGNNRTTAEEILEGSLISAQRSYEEKKIKYIGNLYANILFDKSINREFANFLIKLSDKLTYRQFCIIKHFINNTVYKKYEQPISPDHPDFITRPDVMAEISDLMNKGILSIEMRISDSFHTSAGRLSGDIAITALGQAFYAYLDLHEIPEDQIEILKKNLK